MARRLQSPSVRLLALIGVIGAAVEDGKAEAVRSDLEEALNVATGELKNDPISSWTLLRLVRFAVQVGLEERANAVARLIPEPSLRGRAQLEVLRARLAALQGRAEDSLLQLVDKDTPAYALAVEAVTRQKARNGADSDIEKAIDSLEPEKVRPFASIGLALGLQDSLR
jgi:hypothetical protein